MEHIYSCDMILISSVCNTIKVIHNKSHPFELKQLQ